MVQSKADRERQKLITDKCQSLIEVLLKDEDNKYCVDCDAKGPRWASWNLGIFLCIRCAGIHRNLGVHISKVKSVNLDAWTPEHVAYMQRMGNSRARAIYEANLPDDFRRPQTDTALESFIRAKYEHKKYIAQDYVDPGPPLPAFNIEEEMKKIKEQKKSKMANATNRMISVTELTASATTATTNPKQRPIETSALKNKIKSTPGLVDLETVAATEAAIKGGNQSTLSVQSAQNALDLLIGIDLDSTGGSVGGMTAATAAAADLTATTLQTNESMSQSLAFMDSPIPVASSNNILDLDLDFSSPPTTQLPQQTSQSTQKATDTSNKVLTKESILSLYSMSPSTNISGNNAPGTDPFGMNLWNSK